MPDWIVEHEHNRVDLFLYALVNFRVFTAIFILAYSITFVNNKNANDLIFCVNDLFSLDISENYRYNKEKLQEVSYCPIYSVGTIFVYIPSSPLNENRGIS